MSRGGFQIFSSFRRGDQPQVISSFQQQHLQGSFPAAGTQFREQPILGYSESIFSLALSKSRCHHSDHLLYFIIFLSIIKWLSILSLYFWSICHTFYLCYCMSALLLFLYLRHSSSIPLGVFPSYSQTESGKGQVASRSHPLLSGEISDKRPPNPSLVGVFLCFRDIPETGYYIVCPSLKILPCTNCI